jgi:acyl-coenzyme A thioesterase PaaI-like protein
MHTTMAIPGSGFREPIETATGLLSVDPTTGHVTLPLTDYVRNTLGAVQGGMMAMTAAAAAERALTAAAGHHIDVVDLQVTYIALAKVGPVATRATVTACDADTGTVDVELVDTGAQDRVTTIVRARGVRYR